ncbi:unnamed protein product [Vicia faba]|uniref:NPH3 domain-containing protein n=1 Tax=Vicia faba TaxID=3906 RepID=A0AAV1B7L2_VICFA|nr:unnamed protein product [Vicia faba]
MTNSCDLQIKINGQQIFLLKEKIISKYCGKVKKILNHQKRRCHVKEMGIRVNDFPGGSDGFELVSRFCYNNGKIPIDVSNVSLLHCCAIYLGMTEEVFDNNLLQQTQTFLEGIHYWKWNDIVLSLVSCEMFYEYADCYGLLEKIIHAVLIKIVQNSDANLNTSFTSLSSSSLSSSSTPSSPESNYAKRFSSSTQTTSEKAKSSLTSKAWWFEDLETLPPKIIEKLFRCIESYKDDNNSLIFTRFLLQYLKTATQTRNTDYRNSSEYAALAETAAYGVIFVERLIGGMLEQATLDDLLVSGQDMGIYYDVNLVIRLVRQFVGTNGYDGMCLQKMKRVGRLIDKYLREISPDQNLKISKFLGVAECLPDTARDCFDGIYRAIDIYLESHPNVPFEERSRLCKCLNYSKLSFGASKDLAKNPRIPPTVAMQALISQQTKIPTTNFVTESPRKSHSQIVLYNQGSIDSFSQEKKHMKLNLETLKCKTVEVEKLEEMNGQVSNMFSRNVLLTPARARASPRYC